MVGFYSPKESCVLTVILEEHSLSHLSQLSEYYCSKHDNLLEKPAHFLGVSETMREAMMALGERNKGASAETGLATFLIVDGISAQVLKRKLMAGVAFRELPNVTVSEFVARHSESQPAPRQPSAPHKR